MLRNGLLKQELLAIITNKKVLIPIIAVLFIPVLYAGMFLWAFWDPYGKMDKLPVAVVNSDTGATMDGEHLKLGDDLVKKLKKSKDFGYKIVSREEGYKGLNNQKYYMLIEIPKDFSENATTLMDKNPKKLELVYVPNEGFNFLSAQIGGTAAEKIRTAVSEKVTETYAETIFDKISDVASGFHQASDGAGKLSDGSKDLDKGAKDLNNGLKTLAEKSIEFNNGVKSADSGANKLASGSNDLYNGLKTLAEKSIEFNNGMQSADSGAGKLASGSTKLKQGLAEADSKMPLLIDGTKAATEEIKTKLPKGIAAEIGSQLSGSVDKLNGGIDEFKTALGKQITTQMSEQMSEQIAEQMSQQIAAQTIGQYNQQKEKMTQLAQTLIKTANSPEQAQQIQAIFQSALQQPIPTQEELQQQLQKQMQGQLKEQLKSGIPAKLGPGLDKGFEQFKTEVDKQLLGATAGLDTKIKAKTDPVFDQLANGLNAKQTELQNGIHQLYLGSKDLNSGASDLSSGMNKLAAGTTAMLSGEDQLLLGSNQLKLGAFDLSKGIGQLTTGAGALTSGAGKLADGSGQLQDGTTKLTDGATELADKLKDGSKEVAKVKADDKTYDMMAKPVKLDKEEVNRVPNYGSGFTPYFLSLGLFVGALVLTIVFSIREPIITPKNGFTWFGSKFTILASCGLIQALVADAIILGPLGLHVQSVPKFILFSIITSLVFITLIQFLVTLFGDVGRFLAILILIFQLTTSAGTFPLELIPNFLQHFNAFLPMTYTVQGFKAVISSGDFSYMWHNFMILAGYVLAFAGCTLIYLTMRHHVKYGHLTEEN